MADRVEINLVPYEDILITVKVAPASGGKYTVQVAGVAEGERAFSGQVGVTVVGGHLPTDGEMGPTIYLENRDFLISSSYPPQVWSDEITPEAGTEYTVVANAASDNGSANDIAYFTVPTPEPPKLYGSKSSKATQLSKIYLPQDGKAKQINKIYGSVNGQTKLIFNHFTAPPPADY